MNFTKLLSSLIFCSHCWPSVNDRLKTCSFPQQHSSYMLPQVHFSQLIIHLSPQLGLFFVLFPVQTHSSFNTAQTFILSVKASFPLFFFWYLDYMCIFNITVSVQFAQLCYLLVYILYWRERCVFQSSLFYKHLIQSRLSHALLKIHFPSKDK